MGRLKPKFRILLKNKVAEEHEDFAKALRRSRVISEAQNAVTEIHNDLDLVLAVTLAPRGFDGGKALSRAVRHNAQQHQKIHLQKYGEERCTKTGARHSWVRQVEKKRESFRCVKCNVWGYSCAVERPLAYRCSICEAPATVQRNAANTRHRWTCEQHAEF